MAVIVLNITTPAYSPVINRTDYLKINSGRITREVNGRARFSGTLEELERGYRPVKGNVIEIVEDGTTVFKGNLRRIVERAHPGTEALQFDVEALDFNAVAGRRLVTAEFPPGSTFYQLINAINTQFLSGEGITLANVANPGPTIDESLRFYYETVASVFNRLSAVTGYVWWIDFDKDLHFHPASVSPAPLAPFGLTWSSANWYDFEVESSDEDYRNRQWERTEASLERILTESDILQTGQTTFQTQAVIREVLSITINGAAKTFIKLDPYVPDAVPGSGYDFYYYYDGQGVFSLDYVPVAGHVEVVRYRGIFSSNVSVANDLVEQAARATAEGGSGIWEAIEEQRSIGGANALLSLAIGRLRQFGSDAMKPRFKTDESGLEPGQLITIDMTPVHDVDAVYTIERVEYDWVAAGGLADARDFFRHTVQCTSVEPFGQPTGYFEKLAEMARIGPPDGEGGETGADAQTDTGGDYEKAVWHIRGALVEGDNGTNHHEVLRDGIPFEAFASTIDGVPPSSPGADCEIDITYIDLDDNEVSIFGADLSPALSALVIPDGQKRSTDPTFMSPSIAFEKRGFLKLNVLVPAGAENVQISVKYR